MSIIKHRGILLKLLVFALLVMSLEVNAFSVVFAKEIEYDSGSRRDPFIPLIGPEGMIKTKMQTGDIVIEGIIFDEQSGAVALINGELYRAGDTVNNATIIQIFGDRILLKQEDEEKTIWLREEPVQKRN